MSFTIADNIQFPNLITDSEWQAVDVNVMGDSSRSCDLAINYCMAIVYVELPALKA